MVELKNTRAIQNKKFDFHLERSEKIMDPKPITPIIPGRSPNVPTQIGLFSPIITQKIHRKASSQRLFEKPRIFASNLKEAPFFFRPRMGEILKPRKPLFLFHM